MDEILAAAALSGPGYEPGCGDVVAVILNPVNAAQMTIAQTTFIEFGVPCEDREETAWGGVWAGEERFPGSFADKFVEQHLGRILPLHDRAADGLSRRTLAKRREFLLSDGPRLIPGPIRVEWAVVVWAATRP